jgi:[ribosomal protein S5]-alanine N-acetyltransferase
VFYQLDAGYHVRSLREEDVDGPYPGWFQDQQVCQYNRHGKFPKTKAYFRDYISSLDREDRVVWAICHETDGHIGNVALEGISLINRTAEFAIILGDRRHWGKGVGVLAGRALVAHGFRKINLHRIHCGTAATNIGMQKLALALGMRQEGCRRSHLFLDGEWVDMLEFGVLREEFDA